jgi:hypothetical protein
MDPLVSSQKSVRERGGGIGHLYYHAISRGDVDRERKAKRINEDVALRAFHVLVRIKAADPGGFLNGLDALRIHDRRTRLRVLSNPFAFGTPQSREQSKPGAFEAQTAKVIKHGLPGREVAWQVPPGAAGTQDVEDRVEDSSQRMGWWSATSGQGR